MEPRARAARHKTGLNFADELSTLLHGTGAPSHPDYANPIATSSTYLRSTTQQKTPITPFIKDSTPAAFPETIRVLDEIITDFIIETSHAALSVATYAGRAKLKYTDFEFVMRRDRKKLGRMQDMMARRRKINEAKKMTGVDEEDAGKRMPVKDMQDFADFVGEEGTGKGRGKGRGRRKRKAEEMDGGEGEVVEKPETRVEEDLDDVDVDMSDLEEEERPKKVTKK